MTPYRYIQCPDGRYRAQIGQERRGKAEVFGFADLSELLAWFFDQPHPKILLAEAEQPTIQAMLNAVP